MKTMFSFQGYEIRVKTREGQIVTYGHIEDEDNNIDDVQHDVSNQRPGQDVEMAELVLTNHTPVKRKPLKIVASDPAKDMSPIQGLPGKKTKKNRRRRANCQSRCAICEVVYGSPDDVANDACGLNNRMMGCEGGSECNYWVHVRCVNMSVESEAQILAIDFRCPRHKNKDKEKHKEVHSVDIGTVAESKERDSDIPHSTRSGRLRRTTKKLDL
ncbi:uncharacterized protein [Clytia hemisphaerica]